MKIYFCKKYFLRCCYYLLSGCLLVLSATANARNADLFAYRDFVPAPTIAGCVNKELAISEEDINKPVLWGDSRLWEVSKADRVSYLFGTMHASDEEILQLPELLEEQLKNMRLLYLEVLPDLDQAELIAVSKMQQLPPGEANLKKLFSAPLYQRTVDILQQYGVLPVMVESVKPWVAYITMSYPVGSNPAETLDFYLGELAARRGIEVKPLETVKEQLELMDSLSRQEQLILLRDTVCYYDLLQKDYQVLRRLYLDNDMQTLYNMGNLLPDDEDKEVYQKVYDELLIERNHRMFKRMEYEFSAGDVLVAVGAMHLPGEEGLLELLAAKGYSLKPLPAK